MLLGLLCWVVKQEHLREAKLCGPPPKSEPLCGCLASSAICKAQVSTEAWLRTRVRRDAPKTSASQGSVIVGALWDLLYTDLMGKEACGREWAGGSLFPHPVHLTLFQLWHLRTVLQRRNLEKWLLEEEADFLGEASPFCWWHCWWMCVHFPPSLFAPRPCQNPGRGAWPRD